MIPIIAFAQNLPCRTYGTIKSERAYALVQTNTEDIGYILAGYTTDFTTPTDTNVLIVRIDSSGNPIRPAKISIGLKTDEAFSMVKTMDGGYVVTGWTRSYHPIMHPNPNDANIFVLKLSNNLALQWGKVYGGYFDDKAFSIIQTSDGGYALTGWTASFGPSPQPNVIVVKLLPNGNVQWAKVYNRKPAHIIDEGYGITETPYGLVVVGRSSNPITQILDAFIMWLDPLGNHLGTGVLSGDGGAEAYSVVYDNLTQTVGVAGWINITYQPLVNTDIFVAKFPPVFGPPMWSNYYGWPEGDEKVMDDRSLIVTHDGHYAVSGWTYSRGPGTPQPGNPNFLVMKIDLNVGAVIWARVHPSLPGANFEEAYPMIQVTNGNYAIAGWTNSFGLGNNDFHFLTLDPMGNRPVCVIPEILPSIAIMWRPDSMIVTIEGLDTTSMPIADTMVQYTEVCPVPVDTVDVGPTNLYFDIPSPIDSTATVVPSCSLYNYGNTTVDYTVQMTIGSFYTATYAVTNHAPKTKIPADFPSWIDWPRGTHTVTVISQLSTDQNRNNDTLTGSITVHVHDVSTTAILYPAGSVDSVATFTPQAQVKNDGNASENFNVKFSISASGSGSVDWFDDTTVTVNAGATRTINFAPWTVGPSGDYVTKCSTELTGDMDNTNDKQTGSFTVVGVLTHNVGTVTIYAPTGEIDSTATITPQAKVKNYGSSSETFNVKFTITGPAKDVWSDDTSVTLNSDEELTIDFEDWTVGTRGDYVAKCSTELSTDMFADNDKKEVSFTIQVAPPSTPGWAQIESMPIASDLRAGKYVKDGGALTTANDIIYAFHSNKSNRFLKYTPGAKGAWTQLETLPYGNKPTDPTKINKKKVGKGAALCYDGAGIIYATKGNGTIEFWAYDLAADSDKWTPKAFAPVPKALKGGTSIVYYDGKVYLLAGGQKKTDTANFFVYDIGTDAWSAKADLELGPNTKVWKDGSCLTINEGTIYALKGGDKLNFFYAYDISSNTWTASESIPRMDSLYGKWKKLTVKDGGAMTSGEGSIYALKGGGNNVFWKYGGGAWSRQESIPRLHKKSVPKTGAALTYADGRLYLLKGNNTREYWQYTPSTEKVTKVTPIIVNTLMSDQTFAGNKPIIDVIPNPFTNLTTIHYTVPVTGRTSLKLYNVAGILIEIIADEYLNAGTYTTTLSAKNLAQGIYFVRYENMTNRTEVKLIIQ